LHFAIITAALYSRSPVRVSAKNTALFYNLLKIKNIHWLRNGGNRNEPIDLEMERNMHEVKTRPARLKMCQVPRGGAFPVHPRTTPGNSANPNGTKEEMMSQRSKFLEQMREQLEEMDKEHKKTVSEEKEQEVKKTAPKSE
jgi:hypothetical protein